MAHLVLIAPPELEPGWRLAGVQVRVARDAEDAAKALREILERDLSGVVGIHEPFWDDLDPALRRLLERRGRPVIVAVPSGEAMDAAALRRARLADTLRRAVGIQFTFRGEP